MDAIAAMVDPVTRIVTDKAVASAFEDARDKPNEMAGKVLPVLLKTHMDDIVEVMAAVNGVTVDEYTDDMTFASLVKDAMELLTDKELFGFLASQQ